MSLWKEKRGCFNFKPSLPLATHVKMDRVYQYKATGPQDDTARVLQVFLVNLPADGRHNLETDIYACQSDDQIRAHAKCLVDGLLYPLKARSCSPSTVTSPVLIQRFFRNYITEDGRISGPTVPGEEGLFDAGWLQMSCYQRARSGHLT